ncbi:MAG TPA: histidinol-phosphate transaminase [Kouleothrix sp.]|uniref:histidinol-phosphate transaminase n=1 Tax=Kouleothrix sp. TaxID=2779161 RepID=UPI002C89C893|nr:histidinol-phosphate transaminase [Kouleothrix sp.]HRC75075.1 histidinol-phosphate transaminase [Kouleothrix sp.]
MPGIETLLRPDIAALEAYTPVAPIEVLAAQLGLPVERIIKLDANESPYGPSPRAVAAVDALGGGHAPASSNQFLEPLALAIYPDPNHTFLRQRLSAYTGQPAERILCSSGSGELIDLLMRAFIQPGDAIVDCPPTFGMYSFDGGIHGARIVNVPRDEAFDLDIAAVAEAVERERAKLLFVTLPNNPTGNLTPRAEIERLLDLPVMVVVDEAYVEFAGVSVADLIGRYPNLAVLRTFSKWAGLAGLRIGYGLFHEDLIQHLWKIKQPYNINVAAQAAALASLDDADFLMDKVRLVVAERDRMYARLLDMPGLHPYPSHANFMLCRVLGADATRLKADLMRRGILVRYFNKPGLTDCVRFSIGTPEQNDIFLAALAELLGTARAV